MPTFTGRIAASVVSAVCVYLAAKFGFEIDEGSKAGLTAGVAAFLLLLWQVVYAVGHKFFDRWLNPGDTASKTLGDVQRTETARLRALKHS